ncbi:hypothetical protein MNBD_GAMMA23-294, partial [hydrothermal vent metagenome]
NNRNALFNYVAQEIIAEFDEPTREVLFKTSFLKRISLSVAKKLTGEPRTKKILHHLSSHQLLTIQHNRLDNSFEYHPLFREFLLQAAEQKYGKSDILQLQNKAAVLLLENSDIQSSAKIFVNIEDWHALSSLIKKTASELIHKGLHLTIKKWLAIMPEHILSNDPWLLYWLGSSKLVSDPKEARNHYQLAYKLFTDKSNSKGAYLSWIGMASSVIFGTDDYYVGNELITMHESLQSRFPVFLNFRIRAEYTFCIFTLMMLIDPLHPDFYAKKKEMEQQYKLVPFKKEKVLLGTFLLNYYLFYGNSQQLEAIDDQLWKYVNDEKLPPLNKVCVCVSKMIRSFMQASESDVDVAYKIAEEIENRHGVNVFRFWVSGYASMLYLSLDNSKQAKKYIDICCNKKDPSRRLEMAQCEYIKSWYAMNNGDANEAARYLEISLEHIKGTNGYVYEFVYPKAYVVVLLENGEITKADKLLSQIEEKYKDERFKYAKEYSIALARAYYYFVTGNEKQFFIKMKSAVRHGETFNVTYSGYWINRHMAKMFAKCLTQGIGENYIRRVIKLRNILPPSDLVGSELWPYPVKIYTLGRFSILLNDQSIDSETRPFDILKTLLAFGGRDVHEEKIMDALWPDAEGDQAQASFKTSLHRLRKVFGDLDVLVLKNHQLSLNEQYAWVDTWAMSRLFEPAQQSIETKDNVKSTTLAGKLMQYYRGHFLSNEPASWAIHQREGLRLRFIRHTIALAQSIENGDSQTAIQCYQRLLETDSLIEEAYQGLIRCYQAQDRPAEARASYEKCVTIFASTSGSSPSSATTSLMKI